MKARYQYRIYPTDRQKQSLAQLFGCDREVGHDALALCKQSEKKPESAELQKKDSKRKKNVTRVKIPKLHNRIADTRKNFLHKLSTKIVNENQVIILEDLNMLEMVKNWKLSRALTKQRWYEFRTLCEVKSEKFGKEFNVISRWGPTSKVGSDCSFKRGKINLSIRSVLCLSCGTEQDRDEKAARNIEQVGMGNRHDSKRAQRDCKTTSVAEPCEASRITAALAGVSISIFHLFFIAYRPHDS